MDIVTVLQLLPGAEADPARAQAVLHEAAGRLGLDRAPEPDEIGQATFVGVDRTQVEEALDATDPAWRDELFEWAS